MTPQERWFVGKVVARVEWRRFDTERARTGNPVIFFTDGSSLRFSVVELDGDYGIDPVYIKGAKG